MRRMLGVRSEYRRSDWYDGMRFNPFRDNVLSCRDEDEHAKLRSKMAAGVSCFSPGRERNHPNQISNCVVGEKV